LITISYPQPPVLHEGMQLIAVKEFLAYFRMRSTSIGLYKLIIQTKMLTINTSLPNIVIDLFSMRDHSEPYTRRKYFGTILDKNV